MLQPGAVCLIFGFNLHSVLQLCLPNTNFCSPATTADRSVPCTRWGAPSSGQASPSAGHVSHACLCTSGKSNEIIYVLLFLKLQMCRLPIWQICNVSFTILSFKIAAVGYFLYIFLTFKRMFMVSTCHKYAFLLTQRPLLKLRLFWISNFIYCRSAESRLYTI